MALADEAQRFLNTASQVTTVCKGCFHKASHHDGACTELITVTNTNAITADISMVYAECDCEELL